MVKSDETIRQENQELANYLDTLAINKRIKNRKWNEFRRKEIEIQKIENSRNRRSEWNQLVIETYNPSEEHHCSSGLRIKHNPRVIIHCEECGYNCDADEIWNPVKKEMLEFCK